MVKSVTSYRIDSELRDLIKDEYGSISAFVTAKLVEDDSISAGVYRSRCETLISTYENLISEMSLSPSAFKELIIKQALGPSFKEYMCQYYVEAYDLNQEVDGHNWKPEAIRLLSTMTMKIIKKDTTFKSKKKFTLLSEVIGNDFSPHGYAKKAKDKIENILIKNKAPKTKLSKLRKFDTTSDTVETIYKEFISSHLPISIKNKLS